MVYLWLNPDMKYAEYGGKTEQDCECVLWESLVLGKPLPPLEQWVTPTLVQYLNGRKKLKKVTDCVEGSRHFINQKAADALSDIWDKHATLYPVILEDRPDEPYYMVVVHTVIDCIDREKSVGTINDFEDDERCGYFDLIREWVFREEEIGDNLMFVLPDNPATIYVTEQFIKQRIVDAGLKGFGFRKTFFDETPFIS